LVIQIGRTKHYFSKSKFGRQHEPTTVGKSSTSA